jgi:hypothetical protein
MLPEIKNSEVLEAIQLIVLILQRPEQVKELEGALAGLRDMLLFAKLEA